jgi:hypothetical protein
MANGRFVVMRSSELFCTVRTHEQLRKVLDQLPDLVAR